jgi:hypothetical protein
MPCICYGCVSGKEEFDKFLKSDEGQEVFSDLQRISSYLKNIKLHPECIDSEFYKVWSDCFSHMMNGCPEND